MKHPRLYVHDSLADANLVKLDPRETHHLLDVLRRGQGDQVEVFDRQGLRRRARVLEAAPGAAVLELLEPLEGAQWVLPVDLAAATIRPSRMEWLVEKASELGARSLRPLLTQRSVNRPGTGRLERWERVALAAAKQCGRGAPLRIEPPVEFRALLDEPASADGLLLDPGGQPLSDLLAGRERLLLLSGPEGGFDPEELAAAEAVGLRRAALPAAVNLRSETAAIVALALAAQALGNLS